MTETPFTEAPPTVTTDWQGADMPGQYQALLALLFAGTTAEDAAA